MTPADIAAIEAYVRDLHDRIDGLMRRIERQVVTETSRDEYDLANMNAERARLAALLAYIRTKDAEREAEIAAAVAKALREAAEVIKPQRDRPCDCEAGGCYCMNTGDAEAVGAWDSDNATYVTLCRLAEAAAIREPKP